MKVHLVDGTYELFRAYYGAPSRKAPDGREVGATLQLMVSMLQLLAEPDVTHVALAFDSVIESFRNKLFPDYKTGTGIEPDLKNQFALAEKAMRMLGLVIWGMFDVEADDALGAGAIHYAKDPAVEQVVICSPDKDLTQVVSRDRIITRDRMRKRTLDEAGVIEKFGVRPASIADWLALVGDSSDGYPGIPRWGAKSSARVLTRYVHLEDIPGSGGDWDIKVRGAAGLAESLVKHRKEADLYKTLATLRTEPAPDETLAKLEWLGADREELTAFCEQLGSKARVVKRVRRWR